MSEKIIIRIFKGKPSEKSSVSDIVHAEINIFSVASGHLYERFLSIMILSVLEHTQSTVKFWFIENFLSPKFKVSCNFSLEYWILDFANHWLAGLDSRNG